MQATSRVASFETHHELHLVTTLLNHSLVVKRHFIKKDNVVLDPVNLAELFHESMNVSLLYVNGTSSTIYVNPILWISS